MDTACKCYEGGCMASYARAMVELQADVELKDTIVLLFLKLLGRVRINDLERQMLDEKLMLVDDHGKPLEMERMKAMTHMILGDLDGLTKSQMDFAKVFDINLRVEAITLYSASVEDRETTDCFFVFQDMGQPLNKRRYHVLDRLVKGHPSQSKSQYAVKVVGPSHGRRIHCPGVPFEYLKTRYAASK
nr:hypothetical protein [Tanacetum cinerariifolium]